MSVATLQPVAVPLQRDDSGALRIGTTRVLLELVVRAYQAGATPEDIVQAYDALKLQDVYAVLAWCLHNEAVVAGYLAEREEAGDALENRLKSMRPVRTNLLQALTERARQVRAGRAEIDQ